MCGHRARRGRPGVLTVLTVVSLGVSGCRPPADADRAEPGSDAIAAVDAPVDPARYDPQRPPVPLTSVDTGGGRIELVGLWRNGPFVRLAMAADPTTEGFSLRGRLGPLFREMGGLLLVDPAHRTVHPVLTPPGATGVTSCLCSPSLLTTRRRALYHADFQVPEDVTEVLVLGDSTPSFGRVRIAAGEPDLAGAGYSWLGGDPPPLGKRAFAEDRTHSALSDPGWPRPAAPAAVTLPADLLFAVGSAELSDDARQRVAAAAERLRTLPAGTTVAVVGHTDSRGGAAVNRRLSERRAEAVAGELAALLEGTGVSATAEGRGEDEPVVADTDAAGEPIPENQARNRRVEVQVPADAAGPLAAPQAPPAADATRSAPAPGELAGVDVVPDPGAGDQVHVGIERVARDADLDLVRVDLLLTLTESKRRIRRSLLGDEALADAGAAFGNGARDLRLVDLERHVTVSPVVDALDHCLCPDEIGQSLLLGTPDRMSVWFPAPPAGTGAVNLLVPRAGLLRDLTVT